MKFQQGLIKYFDQVQFPKTKGRLDEVFQYL